MSRIIAFLILLSSVTAGGQSWYFYDQNGNPIVYEAFDNLVAVRVDPDAYFGSALAFAQAQPEIVDTTSYLFLGQETFLFPIEPGYSLSQAMSNLRLNESVWMVNPALKGVISDTLWLDNSLIAIVKQETLQSEVDSLQGAYGLTLTEVLDESLRVLLLERESPYPSDIMRLARDLYQTGLYYSVEPNIAFRAIASSADPYYIHQWQYENTGQQGGLVDSDVDWEASKLYYEPNMTPPVVAIIDMGFQLDHEDLQGQGYVFGYDAAGFNYTLNIPDSDPSNDCFGSEQQCWHGTAVLGLLDATLDNQLGIAGFENRPAIIPIKASDNDGRSNAVAFYRALRWARIPHGPISAKVVSMSINNSLLQSSANNLELYQMYKAGKAVIASAGNAGAIVMYPATSPHVLAVGMTDRWDNVVIGGAGPALDVVAPAVDIWSLDLMGDYGKSNFAFHPCDNNLNYVCNESGTSYAAPLVAGIACKMLIAKPDLLGPPQDRDSAELIYEIIRHSADRAPYGGGDGRVNDLVGWGRVNADHAVAIVKRGDANNDGQLNVSDAVFILAHIFGGGPTPQPNPIVGDANCSGGLSISDAVFIIAYIFGDGADPRSCLR